MQQAVRFCGSDIYENSILGGQACRPPGLPIDKKDGLSFLLH